MNTPPIFAVSQAFADGVSSFAGLLWGWPLIILLFGTHLFLTFRLGFIQRFIGRAIRLSVTKEEGAEGDVSNFGALVTALAATIGTGNIIGVAGAVAMGGPGAVLWMWLTGVFGIATKYTEALLAVKYRVKLANGTWAGGPMYVLERALGMKWLGILFAIFTCIAAFGIGCMTQANSVVSQIQQTLPDSNPQTVAWVSGIAMSALTAFVVLGGIKSIARFCEFLVPIMAAGYVLGCVAILIKNWAVLDDSIILIFKSAFTGQAALGGFVGAGLKEAMRAGIARGLFSNESGLGSAPIVAAAAQTRNPVRQALVSSTGTFWDTVVVCLATGLVIVSSGHWQEGLDKTQLTRAAFADLNVYGPSILTFGLLTFVFSTILGWNYYGEKAAEYLFGTRAVFPYRILWVLAVLVGSVHKDQLVWDFADIANAFMALPNIIALLALSGIAARETRANRHELTGKLAEENTR
ncbi:AGCS family alanine or glycine:cation symporter [Roseimicrobium gellanilyticum]|uniref:AGCS family alanine or glycine:cation symporter n=1 Tax=Roseimicrobium gellanilyticum TaxID=748857 RepID=A0A366HP13_9BACT|nr:sodium:alanine symporter family protein [Roseimicrobium gellanilyticum]RBP45235.1 AGCS family alanine or glycine:cation symporter [Roseimicrobium gellanilyticum]